MSEGGDTILPQQQTPEGVEMKKIVLVNASEGQRGQNGKKKIYEIVIKGTVVTLAWGKAEEANRQVQTKVFATEWQAVNFAEDKKYQKMDKGYQVILVA